jgi:hypothetical protein
MWLDSYQLAGNWRMPCEDKKAMLDFAGRAWKRTWKGISQGSRMVVQIHLRAQLQQERFHPLLS